MKRSNARELAFKTIYSKFFNPEVENDFEGAESEGLEFTTKILKSFAENYNEINEITRGTNYKTSCGAPGQPVLNF